MSGTGWLKKQILQRRSWVLYDQILVSGVSFFTMVFLGRHLELEAFGHFTLAYLSVIFLGTLQTALITQPLNLIGAVKNDADNLGHLVSLQRLQFAWLPLNILVLGCISYFFFPQPDLFIAGAVYLCAFQLQQLLRRYWYTCGQIKHAFVNDSMSYGVQMAGLMFLGLQSSFDGVQAFYLLALASLLAVAQGWRRLRHLPRHQLPLRDVVVEHWNIGSWLLLGTLSSYSATQLYPYMLAEHGPGMVAMFAASANILNGLNVFVQAANNYLPIRAKQVLQQEGVEGLRRFLARIGLMVFPLAAVFCAVVEWWADDLLRLLYGENFAGSGNVLRIFAVGVLGWTLFPVVYAGILALGQTSIVFASNAVATLFAVTAGWWLVRQFGAQGAALAVNVSVLLILLLQAWRLRASLAKSLLRPLPASQGG